MPAVGSSFVVLLLLSASCGVVAATAPTICTGTDRPWQVVEGEDVCEVVEDGCVQSTGFPNNYSSSSSCVIMARRGAYILDPWRFQTELGSGVLEVNGQSYSGSALKRAMVFGTMRWSSDERQPGRGWKICPRSSCGTFTCPDGYMEKPDAHLIGCEGLECSDSTDLTKCCAPLCHLSNTTLLSGTGRTVDSSSCKEGSWYTESSCSLGCEDGLLFAKGSDGRRQCNSSGDEFMVPECVAATSDAPPWDIQGAGCERYSIDCVQTVGYPGRRYTGPCKLRLPAAGFEITVIDMDLEENFDYLRVRNTFSVTGTNKPDPFVLPEGAFINFIVDDDLSGTGFRACARPLCSRFVCPEGFIFRCNQVNVSCEEVLCEDGLQTCCRPADAGELAVMAATGRNWSDAISEDCLAPTTPTTTTTTTTTDTPLQIVGWVSLDVPTDLLQTDSNLIADAWQLLLSNITGQTLEDTWILAADVPTVPLPQPALVNWRIGYQVKHGQPFIEKLLAMQMEELALELNKNLEVLIANLSDDVNVLDNQAAWERPGLSPFRTDSLMCRDQAGWVDDNGYNCDFYDKFCTRFGTSNGHRYYAYYYVYSFGFDDIVARQDPSLLTGAQACCECGGGTCRTNSFRLKDSIPKFCAPCGKGTHAPTRGGNQLECTACVPGTYNPFMGVPCQDASPGRHVPTRGAATEWDCPVGSYSGEAGQSACEGCKPGAFTERSGSTACALCQPGQFSGTIGNSACSPCPAGFFSDADGATNCSACPAGMTGAQALGSSACEDCEPGRFAFLPGAEQCDACAAGRFASSSGQLECETCSPAFFAALTGQSTCSTCDPGTQSLTQGSTACSSCPTGRYKGVSDRICETCPVGRYGDLQERTACKACVAGSQAAETGSTSCELCQIGRFSESAGTAECPGCALGTFSDMLGATGCIACAQGRFAGEEGLETCQRCPNGTFAPSTSATSCYLCDPGWHAATDGLTRCDACLEGSFSGSAGSSACSGCQEGRFTPVAGLSMCSSCQPGWFAAEAGSSECEPCARGSFSEDTGSSECHLCSQLLPGPARHWTTFQGVFDDQTGQLTWNEATGALNVSACGCRAGTQPVGATSIDYVFGGPPADPIAGRGQGCAACDDEGLQCQGMGKLRIESGYAWDGELSVYDCSQGVLDACPGGIPGVCAEGRDTAAVACARCQENKVSGLDGKCEDCSGEDYGVPIGVVICGFLLGLLAYVAYDRPERRRPSLATLLVLISMGQLITIVQQIGIISAIRVTWSHPMSDVFEFIDAISFLDVNLLRPSCAVSMDPVKEYSGRVLMVFASLAFVSIAHLLSQVVQHSRGTLCARMPVLLNALGAIVMAFFVWIITTMLGPLQCKDHPNGRRTVAWYPSVLCWDSDDHTAMFAVGIVACIMPLLFLAACVWAVMVFPRQLLKGAKVFLLGWAFLFFRFHTSAYWYGLALLVRNTLISVAPALHEPANQILMLEAVMVLSMLVVTYLMPWRAYFANWLEIFSHVIFLMLALIAAFFVDDAPARSLAFFGLVIIIVIPLAILCVAVWAVLRMCESLKKPYQFFLCHHKAGAGCFARLLKMKLLKTKGVNRKVFIDTDDLQNLDNLFNIVHQETEILVALHSDQFLFRPWCVGEIVTAHQNGVLIKVVRMAGAERPSQVFIDNFQTSVPDTECLARHGLTLEMVEAALEAFAELAFIQMPAEIQDEMITELSAALLRRESSKNENIMPRTASKAERPRNGSMLILCDTLDLEATSTSLILREMLQPIIAPRHEVAAHIPYKTEHLPTVVKKMAFVCSERVFESIAVDALHALRKGPDLGHLAILPVMCTASFLFPRPESLSSSPYLLELAGEDIDSFVMFILSIFSEIGVDFKPAALSMTEAALSARAAEVADRLWSTRATTSKSGNIEVSTPTSGLRATSKTEVSTPTSGGLRAISKLELTTPTSGGLRAASSEKAAPPQGVKPRWEESW